MHCYAEKAEVNNGNCGPNVHMGSDKNDIKCGISSSKFYIFHNKLHSLLCLACHIFPFAGMKNNSKPEFSREIRIICSQDIFKVGLKLANNVSFVWKNLEKRLHYIQGVFLLIGPPKITGK